MPQYDESGKAKAGQSKEPGNYPELREAPYPANLPSRDWPVSRNLATTSLHKPRTLLDSDLGRQDGLSPIHIAIAVRLGVPGEGKSLHRFKAINHWPANGLPPALGVSTKGNFFISAPFWAVLGRFVSELGVKLCPCGPKMGRRSDRKMVVRVGHSGPFWTVLGHCADLSPGDSFPVLHARRGGTI